MFQPTKNPAPVAASSSSPSLPGGGPCRRFSRRLEVCLLILCVGFLAQFLWLTSVLQRIADDYDPTSTTTKSSFAASPPGSAEYFNSYWRLARVVATTSGGGTTDGSGTRFAADLAARNNDGSRNGSKNRKVATARRKGVRRNAPEWKRKHWDPGSEGLQSGVQIPLKVEFPVFVASLPKSGTTSMWQYFQCGGHSASHQWVKRNDTYAELTGRCVHDNVLLDRPPFSGCGSAQVFTDTGYAKFAAAAEDEGKPLCYFPSISALDAIYRHYPEATIVMVVRNSSSWYDSMNAWAEGTLLKRWTACNLPHFPSEGTPSRDAAMAFYEWHTNNVRRFAREHPSLAYVEVQLESDDETGRVLEERIGIPSRCWGKCTPTSKFCQRISTSS